MTDPPAPKAAPREGPAWCSSGGVTRWPLVFPALPPEVPFGVLGRLMPPSLAAEARLELHRIPRGAALEALDRAGAIAEAELLEGPGGGAERPEIERVAATTRELARRVAGREQELWRVGLVVAGRAASRSRAERTTRDLARRFSSLGFQVRPPRFGAEDALAPPRGRAAETRPAGYWHTLHTDGVAAFFPFVDEAVVEPGGVLVGLQLEDASPVIVNRWNHASHSWGIFGTTGSGKSFAAALLGLRGRWVDPEGELIIIDPLGEFVPFVRALGGEVLRLGPDAPARLNPLDPVSTGGDRAEKAARIGPLIHIAQAGGFEHAVKLGEVAGGGVHEQPAVGGRIGVAAQTVIHERGAVRVETIRVGVAVGVAVKGVARISGHTQVGVAIHRERLLAPRGLLHGVQRGVGMAVRTPGFAKEQHPPIFLGGGELI